MENSEPSEISVHAYVDDTTTPPPSRSPSFLVRRESAKSILDHDTEGDLHSPRMSHHVIDISPDLTVSSDEEEEREEDEVVISAGPGTLQRTGTFLKGLQKHLKRAKKEKNPRRLFQRNPSVGFGGSESADDSGVLFGVKRKHFKAQLNLSILTFATTAFISIIIILFCALMVALASPNETQFASYMGLVAGIGGAWLPSPTTLLKDGKKKKK